MTSPPAGAYELELTATTQAAIGVGLSAENMAVMMRQAGLSVLCSSIDTGKGTVSFYFASESERAAAATWIKADTVWSPGTGSSGGAGGSSSSSSSSSESSAADVEEERVQILGAFGDGERKRLGLPEDYEPWSRVFLYDAGFGSVKMAVALGRRRLHVIACVKTAHARFPKAWLLDTMKDMTSGTAVFLEITIDNVVLVAIGYRYNRRKTLFFIATRGAGATTSGVPFTTWFHDTYGNRVERYVDRPAVLSRYFLHNNLVDSHNQRRQGELELEERWVVKCGWLRCFTTIFGITVTDTHLAVKHSVHKDHPLKDASTRRFIDLLSHQMINNTLDNDEGDKSDTGSDAGGSYKTPLSKRGTKRALSSNSSASSASSSTVSGVSDDLPEPGKYDHHHIRFPNLKPNQKHRTMKPCKVCKSKTAYYCGALQCMKDEGGNPQMVPLCQDSAGCNKHGRGGRMCMEKHKRHSARFAEVHQKEQTHTLF